MGFGTGLVADETASGLDAVTWRVEPPGALKERVYVRMLAA